MTPTPSHLGMACFSSWLSPETVLAPEATEVSTGRNDFTAEPVGKVKFSLAQARGSDNV